VQQGVPLNTVRDLLAHGSVGNRRDHAADQHRRHPDSQAKCSLGTIHWAVLRNSAYRGLACFGKTRAATRSRKPESSPRDNALRRCSWLSWISGESPATGDGGPRTADRL